MVDIDQLAVRADAGGGNVILNSAYALLQGLYPSTSKSGLTLANGTTVLPPLGGFQYIPGKLICSCSYFFGPLTIFPQCNRWNIGKVRLSRAGWSAWYGSRRFFGISHRNLREQYFQSHLNRTYASAEFTNMSAVAQPFLTALKPYLGGISNNFTNMVCYSTCFRKLY